MLKLLRQMALGLAGLGASLSPVALRAQEAPPAVNLSEGSRMDEAARIAGLADELFHDRDAPVLGNPDGSITIVEFFDYNCYFCRRTLNSLQTLIQSDPEIRVVLREWPILGTDSAEVARLSLASAAQGKYAEFHHKLMLQRGTLNGVAALRVATEIGLDTDRLQQDARAEQVGHHLQRSLELAKTLDLRGTPSWIVGDRALFGFMSSADLQAALEDSMEAPDLSR